MRAEEQYSVISAAPRFFGRMPAFLHFRWKYAARVTKEVKIASCKMRADFRRARPMFCLFWERLELAVYAAPLPFSASTTEEMAPKVVRTRPGCMGEW